jgi:hypothetical protein
MLVLEKTVCIAQEDCATSDTEQIRSLVTERDQWFTILVLRSTNERLDAGLTG